MTDREFVGPERLRQRRALFRQHCRRSRHILETDGRKLLVPDGVLDVRPHDFGDFEISVDYRNASITRFGGSPGIQIALGLYFGGQSVEVVRSMFLKHYTNSLSVNCTAGSGGSGRYASPYATVNEALQFYHKPANSFWTACKVKVTPGNYAESFTLNEKPTQLMTRSGTAKFGSPARLSITFPDSIKTYPGGGIKLY